VSFIIVSNLEFLDIISNIILDIISNIILILLHYHQVSLYDTDALDFTKLLCSLVDDSHLGITFMLEKKMSSLFVG
jgi:hypothetical protein